MSYICTDQGASNTRFSINGGKVYVNPNNMTFVDKNADIRLVPTSDDMLDNLDVTIEKTEGTTSDFFPCRVLIGDLAERYSSSNERPSMMSHKSKQRVNYVSIIVACAMAQQYADLDDDLHLYLNLPPVEIKENEDYVKDQLIGTHTVTFNKTGQTKTVKINYVKVCAESVMASIAFFFQKNGQPRPELAKYARGYILTVDIGASTSDLALLKDKKNVERSNYSYKIGGNVITDRVTAAIRGKYGTELSPDDANIVVTEGRMPYGSKYKDVHEELEDAKREFVNLLYSKMETYFNSMDVPLQSIKAIFVSGGGSMRSEYYDSDKDETVVTTQSVSHYLTEKLLQVCDGIDVIQYPGPNARMANIIGTALTAFSVEQALRQKEAASRPDLVAE